MFFSIDLILQIKLKVRTLLEINDNSGFAKQFKLSRFPPQYQRLAWLRYAPPAASSLILKNRISGCHAPDQFPRSTDFARPSIAPDQQCTQTRNTGPAAQNPDKLLPHASSAACLFSPLTHHNSQEQAYAPLFPDKSRIPVDIPAQISGKQQCLNKKYHSHLDLFFYKRVHDLILFALLICRKNRLSCIVIH